MAFFRNYAKLLKAISYSIMGIVSLSKGLIIIHEFKINKIMYICVVYLSYVP
jgi:hypothetical protein